MKQSIIVFAAIVLFSTVSLYADFGVENRGSWPENWPKELEPLRAQSRTLDGPSLMPSPHYVIPFNSREEFEAAWPHLLKVKTKGTSIVLRRGPSVWLDNEKNAGVCVHARSQRQAAVADEKNASDKGKETFYIELIVDGEIVDLNRIFLPADTSIVDERFK